MNVRHTLFAVVAVMLMAITIVDPSFAQYGNGANTAGGNLLNTLQGAITGNLGFFIGLAITLLGVWTWIVKQETGAGIVMIVGGVLITLVPGLFNGAREFMGGVVQSFGGSNAVQVKGTAF